MIIVEKVYERTPQASIEYFRSWLYSVIRNQCISHIRSQKRQHEQHNSWTTPHQLPSLAPSAFEETTQPYGFSNETILLALQELDPDQRQCLKLFYFDEKSYKEISQITSFNLNQVKSYLQNGKRKLKILLEGIQQDKS